MKRLLAVAAALVISGVIASPAFAIHPKFRVYPGVGIGPVSVGDTRADLNERLGKPEREGAVWRYKVRVSDSLGIVKVLFDGKRAMNVFTDDSHFRYRGVHVDTARDEAVRVLRGAGFRLGRCGPGRSLYKPDKRTTFDLYRGEVETIFVVRDPADCVPG